MTIHSDLQLDGNDLAILEEFCDSHTVTIKYFVTTQGAGMGKKRVPTAVSGAPTTCRIVEAAAFDADYLQMPDYNVTHVCFFTSDPTVEAGDYWIEYDSRQLWVRGVRNADNLDQMWIVLCEEKKSGD